MLFSFKASDGDTVECVDRNKQLAFKNYLLRNHKIQVFEKKKYSFHLCFDSIAIIFNSFVDPIFFYCKQNTGNTIRLSYYEEGAKEKHLANF